MRSTEATDDYEITTVVRIPEGAPYTDSAFRDAAIRELERGTPVAIRHVGNSPLEAES